MVQQNKKRGRHHTGWAGALATGAELSRRSYDASITLGNTPTLDLLCNSPQGCSFQVQVKSLSAPNAVAIQKRLMEADVPRNNFFFVIVLFPKENEKPARFFILTHAEVIELWKKMPRTKKNGEPYKAGWEGLNWGLVADADCENRWGKLPP